MLVAQKSLQLQDKVVFEKMTLQPQFKRLPKTFYGDEACFLFVTEGTFKFRTPTDGIRFKEGDGMLAQCGNYLMETLPTHPDHGENTVSVIGAFFYPEMVREFFKKDLEMGPFQEPIGVSKISVEPMMKSFIDGLDYLLDNPSLADENLIVTKLKELLILLSKSSQSRSVQRLLDSLFTPYAHDFKNVVRNNLYSDLTVAELAYLSGMSPATFKRKFRDVYGQSPAKYMLKRKLEYALQLLKIDTKTIAEIAYESGFNSASAFNKSFRKHLEITPTAFRNGQKGKSLSHLEN